MIKVSFLIPAYNASKTIRKCLDSILDSSLKKDEYQIIVWNDGSSDDTVQIVTKYVDIYNNIKIYSKENRGVAEVRKNLFALAEGTYIWECDSDDYLVTENIEHIVNYAFDNDLEVLSFDYNQIYEEGKIYPVSIKYRHGLYVSFLWNKLYKTRFLRDNKVVFMGDLYTGDDVIFNCQAYSNAIKTAYLPIRGYYYVYNPLSLTRDNTRKYKDINSMIHCLDYMMEYRTNSLHKSYWDNYINKDLLLVINMVRNYKGEKLPELTNSLETVIKNILYTTDSRSTKIIINYPRISIFINNFVDCLRNYCSILYSKIHY